MNKFLSVIAIGILLFICIVLWESVLFLLAGTMIVALLLFSIIGVWVGIYTSDLEEKYFKYSPLYWITVGVIKFKNWIKKL